MRGRILGQNDQGAFSALFAKFLAQFDENHLATLMSRLALEGSESEIYRKFDQKFNICCFCVGMGRAGLLSGSCRAFHSRARAKKKVGPNRAFQ